MVVLVILVHIPDHPGSHQNVHNPHDHVLGPAFVGLVILMVLVYSHNHPCPHHVVHNHHDQGRGRGSGLWQGRVIVTLGVHIHPVPPPGDVLGLALDGQL